MDPPTTRLDTPKVPKCTHCNKGLPPNAHFPSKCHSKLYTACTTLDSPSCHTDNEKDLTAPSLLDTLCLTCDKPTEHRSADCPYLLHPSDPWYQSPELLNQRPCDGLICNAPYQHTLADCPGPIASQSDTEHERDEMPIDLQGDYDFSREEIDWSAPIGILFPSSSSNLIALEPVLPLSPESNPPPPQTFPISLPPPRSKSPIIYHPTPREPLIRTSRYVTSLAARFFEY